MAKQPAKKPVPAAAEAPPVKATGADPKKSKASGLMAGLLAKAKTPAPSVPKTKARPTLPCDNAEEAACLDAFCAADAVKKVADAKQADAKARSYAIFRRKFLKSALKLGYVPDNPVVTSEHSRANLIVKHLTKMKSVDANGNLINIPAQLTALGLNTEDVTDIVGNDKKEGIVKVKQQLGVRKFNELMAETATAEEQAVGEKVMALLAEHLNDDEKALVLEAGEVWEVDPMWQDLAVSKAKKLMPDNDEGALNLLEGLFRVISPQILMSQMNFSGELVDAFGKMQVALAESTAVQAGPQITDIKQEGSDTTYRAKIIGTEVHLFLVKPDGGEQPLGTKACEDFHHATATVKMWKRQPAKMTDFLAAVKK